MSILSIRLSKRESARVARVARQRNLTRSELVREALALVEESRPGSALEAWADAVAIVEDAPSDLSTAPRHLADLGKKPGKRG